MTVRAYSKCIEYWLPVWLSPSMWETAYFELTGNQSDSNLKLIISKAIALCIVQRLAVPPSMAVYRV